MNIRVKSFLVLALIFGLAAQASIPFPDTRPDRTYSTDLEGIWKGNLTVGDPIEGVCVNSVGNPKLLKLKLCNGSNTVDSKDTITGIAAFKRRYKLLQRDASFKRIAKKNRFRLSTATNGTDNPGGELATALVTWFQKKLNDDDSVHGTITMNIADSDSTELDGNGDPTHLTGDLVVTLGNCISGVLKKVGSNPSCPSPNNVSQELGVAPTP